jgi:4-carboxymuconolactone decarboxylase
LEGAKVARTDNDTDEHGPWEQWLAHLPMQEAARRFTPELTELVSDPLYSRVWNDQRLSPRDRSIATLAALTVLYRPDELPTHLRRGIANGLTVDEISAVITHVAFYGGFPAAISASIIAAETLL